MNKEKALSAIGLFKALEHLNIAPENFTSTFIIESMKRARAQDEI